MERATVACIVALVLCAPLALAASDLRATSLQLAGSTDVQGDASALFFVSERDGFDWDASASSATLVREYATFRGAAHPLNDGTWLAFLPSDWETETIEIGALGITSEGVAPGGAMLIVPEIMRVMARSNGLVDINAMLDPQLGQDEPADAGSNDRGEILRTFEGEYLNATFSEGVFTLTGEITLEMFGPAYTTTADDGSVLWQTGEFSTSGNLYYQEGRQERHTLTLHDAVLQLRASEPTTLLMTYPVISVDGTLRAPRAEGALVLGGQTIAAPADGSPLTWSGRTALALAPASGFVSATVPEAVLASATIAAQGPPILLLSVTGLLLLAASVGGVALWRRRARRDDFEMALLAMEERRWNDALPRLTRVVRAQPDNAHALIDRALCLEQVGRFSEAAKAFEVALRSAPRQAEAHFYYARTLAKMKERDAARVHLEEALERDPRLVEMVRAEATLRGL